jgi:leucyl-tRNA synthetase
VLLLTPITPHISQALWTALGHTDPAHAHAWPTVDQDALRKHTVTLAVQVNGKLRGTVDVPPQSPPEVTQPAALALPAVQALLGDKQPKRIIDVQDKIVNIVI